MARHLGPTSEWHIYLTARDEKRGLEAVRRLREKGLSVRFHQLDITESESRHKLYDFMKTNYPNGINILINNAGILREVCDSNYLALVVIPHRFIKVGVNNIVIKGDVWFLICRIWTP